MNNNEHVYFSFCETRKTVIILELTAFDLRFPIDQRGRISNLELCTTRSEDKLQVRIISESGRIYLNISHNFIVWDCKKSFNFIEFGQILKEEIANKDPISGDTLSAHLYLKESTWYVFFLNLKWICYKTKQTFLKWKIQQISNVSMSIYLKRMQFKNEL